MAKLAVLDKTGKKVSDIELKDEIFAIEPNKSAMHLEFFYGKHTAKATTFVWTFGFYDLDILYQRQQIA